MCLNLKIEFAGGTGTLVVELTSVFGSGLCMLKIRSHYIARVHNNSLDVPAAFSCLYQ